MSIESAKRGRGRPRMDPALRKSELLQVRVPFGLIAAVKTACTASEQAVSVIVRTLLEEWLRKLNVTAECSEMRNVRDGRTLRHKIEAFVLMFDCSYCARPAGRKCGFVNGAYPNFVVSGQFMAHRERYAMARAAMAACFLADHSARTDKYRDTTALLHRLNKLTDVG